MATVVLLAWECAGVDCGPNVSCNSTLFNGELGLKENSMTETRKHAADNDLTLKAAALKLGFVTDAEFDRIVDPKKMVRPYVAKPLAA